MLRPGGAGYDDLRRSFNALIDRRPALIAACETEADVIAALRYAREQALPIAVRGGGHSVAGHGLVDDGLVIDLRRMRGVEVDAERRVARTEGGATWIDVDTASQLHGLAVAGGTFTDTGVVGLALGGGIGYLIGTSGLTCDNIVGARLVTGAGEVLEVSDRSDPDLLWALRGGGGNFGIVTALELSLVPVGPMVGGDIEYQLEDGQIIDRYAAVQREAPDEFVVLAYARHHPSFGPTIAFDVASLLDDRAARQLFDAIVGGATPVEGEIGPRTYADIQAINPLLPFGMRHYWKSAFVPDLSAGVIAEIVDLVAARAPGTGGMLLEPIHGAARRRGFDHSPFPQREARFHVSAMSIWKESGDDEREIAWSREAHRRVSALGTTGTYVNYIAPDEPVDRATSTWPPEVLARLRAVKRRVDPENRFRSNINIAPAD